MDPGVENGEYAAVTTVANESAETLLQGQDRERHLVLEEGVASTSGNGLDSRSRDWVGGRCEGQFVDDHTAECFASDVHALPETRRAEEHGMCRRTKFPKQRRAWSGTLDKQGVAQVRFHDSFDFAQGGVARKEYEGPAPGALQDLDDFLAGGQAERGRSRIGQGPWEIEDSLARKVEFGRQAYLMCASDSESPSDVVERPLDCQRS